MKNKLMIIVSISMVFALNSMEKTLQRTAFIRAFLRGEFTINEDKHIISFAGPIDGEYEIQSRKANNFFHSFDSLILDDFLSFSAFDSKSL